MAARVIYLDQNKWIELAQAVHGKANTHLLPIVDFVQQIKASGLATFPLSLAHHMETSKRLDAGQQERLGRMMWEISDGCTFASPKAILQSEIDAALVRTFQRTLNVRPLELVGKGLAHATAKSGMRFTVKDPDSVVPENTRLELEQFANRVFDYSVLTGTTPWGPAPRPRPDLSAPGRQFVANMAELREKLADVSDDLRRRTIYARLMVEIYDDLVAALTLHGFSIDEFAALGLESGYEGYIRFLEALPSVRVNAHLYTKWLQNPQLPFRENDLNDWYYVGAAVAHADVVVTDKHLAHIVNNGNLTKRAVVISDLRDLPSA
jgi:hypothetical protein